jgi:hypothetical protein
MGTREIFQPNILLFGSSPNSLIKYFVKADKGPEGKADCAASIGGILLPKLSPLDFRKARRRREKKPLMRQQDTPATAKKGQLPHDCKQYDFPSGPLESLDISKISALGPSTNLEMILLF